MELFPIPGVEVRSHQQDATGKAIGMNSDDLPEEWDGLGVPVLVLENRDKHVRF